VALGAGAWTAGTAGGVAELRMRVNSLGTCAAGVDAANTGGGSVGTGIIGAADGDEPGALDDCGCGTEGIAPGIIPKCGADGAGGTCGICGMCGAGGIDGAGGRIPGRPIAPSRGSGMNGAGGVGGGGATGGTVGGASNGLGWLALIIPVALAPRGAGEGGITFGAGMNGGGGAADGGVGIIGRGALGPPTGGE
jgi:hypothetical protein